ncbi:MAG TPA: hypothetical protein PLA94_25435 [Myxococcota bacterium]|nr:hypothetical protein [Myxococcota bacterium]
MLVFLLACQEPFPEDRHDLVSFRIAAITAEQTTDGLRPRALLSSSEGFYHSEAPRLLWTLGDQVQEGARPLFANPVYPLELHLRAELGELAEEAVYPLTEAPIPPVVEGWSRARVDLKLEDAGKPIEERRLEGEDLPVEPGGAVQVGLQTEARSRWMGTGGEFAELDAQNSTWFAGNYLLDDDEVEEAAPVGEGLYQLVALSFDEKGGNRLSFIDVAVGESTVMAVGGRLLPVDSPLAQAGWYEATFTAADSRTGFTLTGLQPVADASSAAALCGEAAGTAFDPLWLLDGACGRDDLEGTSVVVWGEPWP